MTIPSLFKAHTLMNQSDAAPNDLLNLLLGLEQQLLVPETRSDEARLLALLAEDFVEFGASGKAWSRGEVIAGLKQETRVERLIVDFAVRRLADTVVLATYLCRHRYPDGSESSSLRSSLWRKDVTGWRMAFHQGTKVPV